MPAVDSLNIKVDASARSANQQLDKLVKKMVELRQTLGTINVDGLNAFTKSMNHFTNAAKALSGIKTSDFTKMAKNLDKLSDTQKLEKTAQNTQKAADSLQKATTIAKTALGNSFKTDGTGIQKMQKSIQALSKEYANAGKGSKFDGTLSELEKEAGKLEKKLDALGEKEQKMLAVGSSTDSKAFKGLQYDISVTLNQLSTLEEKIAQVKASQAQNISNLPIIRYEAQTGNTSLASQNIKEQTEKVEQTDKVEQTEKVFETIPESARYSVEKAQKALQDALKSVHIDKGQSSAFRNYSEEIKNLKAELKSLETAGYGMGSAKWDETYIKLQKVVAEAKEYKANLSKPSTGLERDIQKTASLGNQLEGLKDKLKGLKANGQNFGDAEFDDTYRQIQKASSALSKYKADLKATGNSKSSLDRLKDTFRSIWNMTKKAGSALSDFGKRTRNLIPGFGLLSNSTNGLIGKIAKLYIAIRSLRGVADYMKNAVTSSMDYIEEYNYFDTTMDKIGLEWGKDYKKYGYRNAKEYGDSFKSRLTQTLGKMSGFQINKDGSLTDRETKNLGLDITQMTNYAAGIAQVTNSVGMAGEASAVTSKALSMLAGDVSSFRNQDLSTVMNNFSSGLIGQSRALYKYGIDITNTTLQQYALANGVNKSVSEMSQSEKMQLRMLAILDQSRVSWGDLAKTINSPSNQLRLLNNNFKALARTVGNMFLPVVAKVLPYVNGLVIAIRRLFEWTASMLGINLKDVIKDSGVGSTDVFDGLEEDANNADTAVGNIGDSADKSSDSVKKLAKQLMGFDELNVINTNDTGSLSKNDKNSSGDSAPIDLTKQLSDALADYENVWNKAYNKMTSDAEKFADKLTKLFKNAWKSGNGSDIGTAIAKWINKGIDWVNKHTGQFANGCKKIANILATSVNGFVRKLKWSGLGKAIGNSMKAVIEAETHFFDTVNWLNLGKGIAKSLNAWIATGVIQSLFRNTASKLRAAIELAFGAITTFKFDKLGTAIGQGINDFFKKMNKKNKQTGLNGWQELAASISDGIKGIATTITTALETVNWENVGQSIADFITGIDWAGVVWSLAKMVAALVKAIGEAIAAETKRNPISGVITVAISAFIIRSGWKKMLSKILGSQTASSGIGVYVQRAVVRGVNWIALKKNLALSKLASKIGGLAKGIKVGIPKVAGSVKEWAIEKLNESVLKDRLGNAANGINVIIKKVGAKISKWAIGKDGGALVQLKESIKKALGVSGGTLNVSNIMSKIAITGASISMPSPTSAEIERVIEDWATGWLEKLPGYDKNLGVFALPKQLLADIPISIGDFVLGNEKGATHKTLQEAFNKLMTGGEGGTPSVKAFVDYINGTDNTKPPKNKTVAVTYEGVTTKNWATKYNKYKKLANKTVTASIAAKYANMATKALMQNPLLTNKGKVNTINKTVKMSLLLNGKKVSSNDLKNLASLAINPDFIKSNPFNMSISKKKNGGIFSGGSWHNIAKYAGGGMPGMGQMFIAREAGPELVGRIGNHTAVMNNNQIVASVSDGVFNALNPVLTYLCNSINVMSAKMDSMGSGAVSVEKYTEGDLLKVVRKENNNYRRRTGKGAFD